MLLDRSKRQKARFPYVFRGTCETGMLWSARTGMSVPEKDIGESATSWNNWVVNFRVSQSEIFLAKAKFQPDRGSLHLRPIAMPRSNW